MLTFVIWAVGLCIMGRLALANIVVVGVAFDKHWALGLAACAASLAGWATLLIAVL